MTQLQALIPTYEILSPDESDIRFSPFEEYMNFCSISCNPSPQATPWKMVKMVIVGRIIADLQNTEEVIFSQFQIASPSNFHERFPKDKIIIQRTKHLLDINPIPVAIYVSYTEYKDEESVRSHYFTVDEALTKTLHQHISASLSATTPSAAVAQEPTHNEVQSSYFPPTQATPETIIHPTDSFSLYLKHLSLCDSRPYSITPDELNFLLQ